ALARGLQERRDGMPGVAGYAVPEKLFDGPVVDVGQETQVALPERVFERPVFRPAGPALDGKFGHLELYAIRPGEAGVAGARPGRRLGDAQGLGQVPDDLLEPREARAGLAQ